MSDDEKLYAAGLEVPLAERAAFLDRACGGDGVLRRRIERLLSANDRADAFFESPVADRPPVIREEGPGDCIGRYKLLQQIGAGGCGVVFMAEQEQPVRRRVALKVIKLGMDTKAVIARFEAERQALARMEHPNIARVLDAGATDAGRPFFVMELVRGIPITRYCDEENLATAERLQLFVQVCYAIQHAHEKGIIHRDIKPTNILVTMHDDIAVPKVIDFGIAKATQGRLTDHTVFTAFEQFIGTPAYMSPEQAQLSDLDLDTRSDIYSLGVLLYELLTGRPPFDPKTLAQNGIDEIRRIIREVEPLRPSTRLSTLAAADRVAVAKLRGTLPAQLSTLMRGDLDWIVMRALEKNRTRRYDTANGLADDIKRHLKNEPVVARPPSVAYRCQKFVARNKVALIGSAAVLVALVAGLSFSRIVFREKIPQESENSSAPAQHRTASTTAPEASGGSGAVSKILLSGTGSDTGGVLSPDESKIVYVEWADKSGDLVVKDLGSGEARLLTKADTSDAKFYDFAGDPVWSPDSRWVGYTWYTSKDRRFDLRLTSLDGQTRVVQEYRDKEAYALDWSPDGKELACILNQKGQAVELTTVNVASGEVRRVLANRANHVRFSPDGSAIVFDRRIGSNTDIYACDLKSRETTRVTDFPTSESSPVWSADGRFVLFSSDRRGTWDLWAVPVNGGKPTGPAFLVRPDFGNHEKRITRRGSLAFNTSYRESDSYYVDVKPNESPRVGAPQTIAQAFLGRNAGGTWSPDGGRVAYVRNRNVLCLQDLRTGRVETMETGLTLMNKLYWSPDGEWMIIAPALGRAVGLIVYNVEKRSGRKLLDAQNDLDRGATDFKIKGWSSDGKEIIVRVYPAEKPRYLAVDLRDGRKREIGFPETAGEIEYFDLSPDQTRIAYVPRPPPGGAAELIVSDRAFGPKVTIASLGVILQLGTMEGSNSYGVWPRWSPDGRMIAYYRHVDRVELHIVAADGSWDETVSPGALRHDAFVRPVEWSRDGTKVAMTLLGDYHGEVGVLENFLPTDIRAQATPDREKENKGLTAATSTGMRPGPKVREIPVGLGPATSDVVAIRKLPLAGASWILNVSPDGRFIAYVAPDWESVSIYETASATSWEIGKTKTETPWSVVFSPDASQIAYDTAGTSLWVAKTDGSAPRELYARGVKKTTISAVAWSAANGQVLARVRDPVQNISTPVFVDLKTREVKEIKPPDGNADWALSSDGRYLAQGLPRKVTLFDLVSHQETTLVDDHIMRMVGWACNDSEFLYSSDRTGTESLWTIAVKSGQPSGEPRLIKEYADGAGASGVTRDGSIFYSENRNSGNVFLVSANFETGEILGEPRLVTDRFPGVQTTPVWSRNGQKLLLAIEGRQRRFVEVSMESGQQQDFPVATFFDRINRYSSAKDGRFLLVAARKVSGSGGTYGIHRFEPASGKVETLVSQKSAEWLSHPRLSPDEKSFYYARRKYTRAADGSRDWTNFIVRHDLLSNHEEIVYQPTGKINAWWPFELSPDGSRLAIVTSDQGKKDEFVVALKVFTLSSGGQKEVIRLAPRQNVYSIAWTPDGKRLVYTKETPGKEKKGPAQTAIWSTAVDSGESVKLELSHPELGALAINPAGRQLAFQTGSIGDTVDVWVMEGMIPKQLAPKEGPRPKVIAQSSLERKTVIPVEELSGPNQSILDRKFGFSATLPAGWSIKSANRTDTWGNHIEFTAPDVPDDARAFVNYRETKPEELATFHGEAWTSGGSAKPTTPADLDAWMRAVADGLERERDAAFQNYKNRPGSFIARTIGGYNAWSWLADYTDSGENWTYYWTLIETGEGGARFQLGLPTARFDAVRPAFDALIESVRLDPARPIPLDEITGPNHSIFDRKFGLAVTYPAGWAISSAVRRSSGATTISLKIPGASHVGITYRSTSSWEDPFPIVDPMKDLGPKPTTPAEIDAWLRRYAQAMKEQRIQRNVTNYRIRVASMFSRTVNGHPALSWVGDFTEIEKNRTEYFTLIYSENSIVRFFVGDSVASIEPFLPLIDEMIGTVRLP